MALFRFCVDLPSVATLPLCSPTARSTLRASGCLLCIRPVMLEAVIGLVGVLLGFGLGAGYEEFKERRNRKRYAAAVNAELKSNLHTIPQKLDTINNMVAALDRGELMPGPAVRFSRSAYDAHLPTLASHLGDIERNSLHLIYEYFRVTDHLLDNFASDVGQALGTEQVHARVSLAKTMLSELPYLLDLTASLTEQHLAGTPRNVYHLDLSYDEVRQIHFTRDRRYS